MAERRTAPRREARHVRLWLTAPGVAGAWASVRDVSAAGVGLLVAWPLAPGTRCQLWPADPAAAPAGLTVVHLREEPGWYVVGCAFDRPLSAEELATFPAA